MQFDQSLTGLRECEPPVSWVQIESENELVDCASEEQPRGSLNSRLEAPPGFEPGMEVLQTSALPLGDGADQKGLLGYGQHRIVPDASSVINTRTSG